MDQVVAADRQRVTIAGDHPHIEVGPGGGQTRGDGRGPPVDGVHSVSVHVIRQTSGTTDTREEHRVLTSDTEVGQKHLHRGQDGVVTTPGAPPDLLVGRPILAGGHGHRNWCPVGVSSVDLGQVSHQGYTFPSAGTVPSTGVPPTEVVTASERPSPPSSALINSKMADSIDAARKGIPFS